MIPYEYVLKIGKILIEIGGANPKILLDNSEFVTYLTKESGLEYRFMGHLGSGGKFRNTGEKWKVDFYSEDFTPKRNLLTKKINEELKILHDEFFKL